ncbi:MAG: hypothetical protein ACQEQF_02865 [Bacillota bacterium]
MQNIKKLYCFLFLFIIIILVFVDYNLVFASEYDLVNNVIKSESRNFPALIFVLVEDLTLEDIYKNKRKGIEKILDESALSLVSFKEKDYYDSNLDLLNKKLSSENLKIIKIKKEKNNLPSEMINRVDNILSNIYYKYNEDKNINLVLLSYTKEKKHLNNRIGWTIFWGKDYKSGLLTSDSTKRRALITSNDINLTILNNFNIEDKKLAASKVKVIGEGKKSLKSLINFKLRIIKISKIRIYFIKIFIILQIFLLSLSIIKRNYNFLLSQKIFEYILLTLLLVPINYFIISNFLLQNKYSYLLLLIVISNIEVYILKLFTNNMVRKIAIIISLFFIFIILDLNYFYKLTADTILGYSSVIGARYYGLGNEYLGMHLSIFIMATSYFIPNILTKKNSKLKQRYFILVTILYIFYSYILISPKLASNFGGVLTILFSYFLYLYFNLYKDKKIKILIIFILLAIFLGLLLVYGKRLNNHLGRVFYLLGNSEYEIIKNIIFRKIKMNIKLLQWTIWSKIFLILLLYSIYITTFSSKKTKYLLNINEDKKFTINIILANSIAILLFNDSGVVASATFLFYPVMILLYFLDSYN